MIITDYLYKELVNEVMDKGETFLTRNHLATSLIDARPLIFYDTPLVTIRKTAWRKALLEMEWFLSGDTKCPPELADTWWKGQLSPDKSYRFGYGHQLRKYNGYFDQINTLIDGINNHPYSRRHVITTWNPAEMHEIQEVNQNNNTPTTCHTTIAQFFVRPSGLHMTSYQRSADLLLGVPHNWIQSWALLKWIACKTKKHVSTMRWVLGDVHIYAHKSHTLTAQEIQLIPSPGYLNTNPFQLIYTPTSTKFLAADFHIEGTIPQPIVTTKPELL